MNNIRRVLVVEESSEVTNTQSFQQLLSLKWELNSLFWKDFPLDSVQAKSTYRSRAGLVKYCFDFCLLQEY